MGRPKSWEWWVGGVVRRLRSSGISFRSVRGRSWRAETLGDYELSILEDEGGSIGARVDAEVRLPDGSRWGASFHTPEDVRAILDRWRAVDGSFGLYFWAPGVIVVRETSREAIAAVVEDLVAAGEIDLAFVRVGVGEDEA
jgi:hypothetical protein